MSVEFDFDSFPSEPLVYPLSFAQQRLWFLDQMTPGDVAYNMPLGLRFRGSLDVGALRKALQAIVVRHEVLRTSLLVVDGQPSQVVHPGDELGVSLRELDVTPEEFEAAVTRAMEHELACPFTLACGPLARASILRNRDRDTVLFLTLHHAVSDGWSLGVLVRELDHLYGAFRARTAGHLPPLPIQYGDFAIWQREHLTGEVLDRQLRYWRQRLTGAAALSLPTDRPRPSVQTFRGSTLSFQVPAAVASRLSALGHEHRATPFMTLLAAWCVLLHRYSGQTDLSIGTPIANRQRAEVEGLVGLFVNTLVLRLDLSAAPTFSQLLGRVKQAALDAYRHQELPFDRVVEELRPERTLGRSPLFQVMFALQSESLSDVTLQGFRGLEVSVVPVPIKTSKFDLTLTMAQDRQNLSGCLEYSSDLFERPTIERMAGHLVALLEAIAREPDAPVSELPLVPPESAVRPMARWSAPGPRAQSSAPACLHHLVAKHVLLFPEADAVVCKEGTLSYRQLETAASAIAEQIAMRGLPAGAIIGVCAASPLNRIAAVLAALKAGGAYRLLPPGTPEARSKAGGDATALVVLDQEAARYVVDVPDARILLEPFDPNLPLESGPGLAPAAAGCLDETCLIGRASRGAAGAVARISHRDMYERALAFQRFTGVRSGDPVLCRSGDEYEFLLTIACGGTVVAVEDGGQEESALSQAYARDRVVVACLEEGELERWYEAKASGSCPALRTVVCDLPVDQHQLNRWRQGTDVRLVRRLACAEAWWSDQPTGAAADAAGPCGPGGVADVIDGQGRSLPVGVPGELAVGCHGPGQGGRLFRSGIRARYEADGRIAVMADSVLAPERPRAIRSSVRRCSPPGRPWTPLEQLVAGVFSDVLGLDAKNPPALESNFFALGGHSLMATLVVSRLRMALQADLSLRTIFESPTVAGLADRLHRELSSGDRDGGSSPIPRVDRASVLPLSYSQQRLWVLDQLQPGQAAYNVPVALRLDGVLDFEALRRSLHDLVERHEALRTRLVTDDGEPAQHIDERWTSDLHLEELPDGERGLARRIAEEASRGFVLASESLFRARLFRVEPERHVLLATMHHIVSDGWSLGILVRDLAELYRSKVQGTPAKLERLPVQYADYAHWQRLALEQPSIHRQRAYWHEHLGGLTALDLPTDHPRPAVQSHRGSVHTFRLPAELYQEVIKLGQGHDATPFMALLAAWFVLLHRYSGQKDLAVGTPLANRQRPELDGVVGFFVNTLVIRADLSGSPSFATLLGRIRELALRAYTNQDVPFEQVVEQVNPARDLGRTPLFQVMFVLQNAPLGGIELPGLRATPLETATTTSKFDLTLSLREQDGGLIGSLEYCTDVFEAATIERMVDSFETLLRDVVRDPSRAVDELAVVSAEQQRLLREWNQTDLEIPTGRCLHELVEETAARIPDAPALVSGVEVLTFAELNARAELVARRLRREGVRPEKLVGVCLERSANLVVALLGTLKAGGGYVPLDPSYPPERLAFILQDTAASVVISERRLAERLPRLPAATAVVWLDQLTAIEDEMPPVKAQESNVAYVIYTSGSTGRPKGVIIEHRNAVAFAYWARSAFPGEKLDGVLASTSICFDLSVFELFVPLCFGGRLVLVRDALEVQGLAERERVHVINSVPSAVTALLDAGAIPRTVRLVNLAGEPLQQSLVDRLYALGTIDQVLNLYGPSETTTYSTMAVTVAGQRPHIGRPISNTQVHILDQHGRLAPLGAVGELYIGGRGVARGYLDRPELTAERFVPDPFSADPGGRMYRTGDLCRWRADGSLEFLGRVDRQVKVRGYRIELGEIEAVLGQHPSLREAVVVAREDAAGEKCLVAHVCPRDPGNVDARPWRDHLAERLPPYMIPSRFVAMVELPLTPNGKIDRAALMARELTEERERPGRLEPRNQLEKELVDIWQDVLGHRPGVTDDFFAEGGTSLSALRLVSAVRRRLNRSVRLADVFSSKTIAGLSAVLEGEGAHEASALVELSPAVPGARSVFCVHPAGGSIGIYLTLARCLGARRGCFGLQAVQADPDLVAMAGRYAEEMRRAQPVGPYALCGWSLGGAVAFEIARQLAGAGQGVSRLVLVDPANLGRGNAATRTELLLEAARAWGMGDVDDLATEPGTPFDQAMELVLARARRAGVLVGDVGLKELRTRFDLFAAQREALAGYRPSAFDGPTTLVWAADRPVEERARWRSLLPRHEECVIEGDHYEIMAAPRVDRIASLLTASDV